MLNPTHSFCVAFLLRPHGPLNLEEIIRPTFQIETKPLGKGAATRTGFGDTQLFDLFVMPWPKTRETGFRWGIGPTSSSPPQAGTPQAGAHGN